jgi:hypothetical protein
VKEADQETGQTYGDGRDGNNLNLVMRYEGGNAHRSRCEAAARYVREGRKEVNLISCIHRKYNCTTRG